MTQLHSWFHSDFRGGFAEFGEVCRGCRRPIAPGSFVVVMRYYSEEKGLWGPPVEVWEPTCFDLCHLDRMRADDVPKIGKGGGKPVRKDRASGEYDTTERWYK